MTNKCPLNLVTYAGRIVQYEEVDVVQEDGAPPVKVFTAKELQTDLRVHVGPELLKIIKTDIEKQKGK